MKKAILFFTLIVSFVSLKSAQECTYVNNTHSKVIVTILYKKLSTKVCTTKTVHLSPQQKEIIVETDQDCLPYFFTYTAVDGSLTGKSGTYEALLPIANSFTFYVNEGPNNVLFFDIRQNI